MTVFEFAVTYAVCWWLVLFMVLPHQAQPAANPELGHAPSAPANPQIGKKIRWATLLAIIPAVAMYFIVGAAQAETIYHAGGKCKPVNATMASDVNATDGYATGGKKVAPATMNGNNPLSKQDHYDIPLWIPTAKYAGTTSSNVDLSNSYLHEGNLRVGKDGSATLDGKSLASQDVPEGCEQPIEPTK